MRDPISFFKKCTFYNICYILSLLPSRYFLSLINKYCSFEVVSNETAFARKGKAGNHFLPMWLFPEKGITSSHRKTMHALANQPTQISYPDFCIPMSSRRLTKSFLFTYSFTSKNVYIKRILRYNYVSHHQKKKCHEWGGGADWIFSFLVLFPDWYGYPEKI